jgi:hypothetical protein
VLGFMLANALARGAPSDQLPRLPLPGALGLDGEELTNHERCSPQGSPAFWPVENWMDQSYGVDDGVVPRVVTA